MNVEDLLLRAALLAGHGRDAAPLAAHLAQISSSAAGRSCVEAGAPLQISVDAPGPPSLRVGVRIGDRIDAAAMEGLVPSDTLGQFANAFDNIPPGDHDGFGWWFFWMQHRKSLLADLRDPSPGAAAERIRRALDPTARSFFDDHRARLSSARPWAYEIEADDNGSSRTRLYWLVSRHSDAKPLVEEFRPGAWNQVVDALSRLLRRPEKAGRWLIMTTLEAEPELRVGNSGWTLTPEDEGKHRAVGAIMRDFGGPRDYAEAMWSFCRGAAAPAWRVGRTCEVIPSESGPSVRLHFTPEVQATTARMSTSAAADSSVSPRLAVPSNA